MTCENRIRFPGVEALSRMKIPGGRATMRGVSCDGTKIHLETDQPEPIARPGEVEIQVRAVGICDTDLQLARGYMGFRGILGHEFVGLTGDNRRVTAEINNSCLDCPTCLAGLPNH